MTYDYMMEDRDFGRINKLNELTNINTYWVDVRKLVKNVKSDHSIKRWQCLADARWKELVAKTATNYIKERRY